MKMLQESVRPLVCEIVARLPKIPNLATAILYGSAARGELTEASDIDLLLVFDVSHNPETAGELEASHKILGDIKTKRKLQIVATNLKQMLEPDFLDNISREGIVIYGKPLVLTAEKLQLKPYMLYAYSVAGLPQIRKSQLQRALSGFRVVKRIKGKEYKSEKEGLLKMLGARKLGKGVVMVPQESSRVLEELFVRQDVKYSKIKIWC